MKNIKSALLVVAMAGVATKALAVTFPNSDGSNDISSEAAWGGASPTGFATFAPTAAGSLFTITKSWSIPCWGGVSGAGKALFEIPSGLTLTTQYWSEDSGMEITYRGPGTIVFGNPKTLWHGKTELSGLHVAYEGIVVSPSAPVDAFNAAVNSSVALNGVSFSSAENAISVFVPAANATGGGNTLAITNGATLTLTSANSVFHVGDGKNAPDTSVNLRNVVKVSGSGSALTSQGSSYNNDSSLPPFYVGKAASGNTIEVTDGASLTTQFAWIGYEGGKHNGIEVDGATFVSKRPIRIGSGVGSDYNYFRVKNTTTCSFDSQWCSGQFFVGHGGGSHNEFVAENATVNARNVVAGVGTGSDYNTVRLSGTTTLNTMVTDGVRYMFGTGSHNMFIIEGGAKYGPFKWGANPQPVLFYSDGNVGNDNELILRGGGVLTHANATGGTANYGGEFWFGARGTNATDYTTGNRMFIGADTTFASYWDFVVCSANSELVVSNGTLSVGSGKDNAYLTVGNVQPQYHLSYGYNSTNSMIVLQGSTPKITKNAYSTSAYFTFSPGQGGGIRFELPPEGYEEAPIVDFNSVTFANDVRLEFTGIEECQKTLRSSRNIPLVATKSQWGLHSVTDERLSAWNNGLPEGCYLKLAKSREMADNTLLLHVKALTGIVLIFR